MPHATAARIAAAQLAGLSRARQLVPAGPFTGLLAPGAHAFFSYAVAANPGEPITDVTDALAILRAAFPPGGLRFELIDQACPGAAEALEAAGLTVTARVPLMTVDPDQVTLPDPPDGVTVEVVRTVADRVAGNAIGNAAFEVVTDPPSGEPPPPEDGGSVLARLHGKPVAVASWTQVADGVTEIVGVATPAEHRRKGLGGLVTAHAVRAAAELAAVRLAWLTPGGDDADRVYRKVGFAPIASAVHLADTPTPLP
ncbi:GNAT family N-acetyltransferase [Actinokineospora sp.]|uniref:GNAT family N-acetyltransferase n=1 Tax=Actinokineospora sp. TaxID=1872133 RepID=UPI00403840E9